VAKNFIVIYAIVRVFRELDRFSSLSGAKIMAKKKQNICIFPRGLAEISLINMFLAISLQPETLESPFKPQNTRIIV